MTATFQDSVAVPYPDRQRIEGRRAFARYHEQIFGADILPDNMWTYPTEFLARNEVAWAWHCQRGF